MSAGKKRKNKNSGDDASSKPSRPEQGALGDLMNRSAQETHITDSREVLNPAGRGTAAVGSGGSSQQEHAAQEDNSPAPIAPIIPILSFTPPAVPASALPPVTATATAAAPAPAPTINIMEEIRSRGSSRFKRLPGETSPRLLVTVALVMSLLVHVAIGVVMAHQSAGKLPVALLDPVDEVQTFRVTAPPVEDPIYTDPVLNSDVPVATPVKSPGLGELSKMMLLNQVIDHPVAQDLTPPPAPQKVEHPDVQPDAPRVDLTSDSHALDIPSDLAANLIGGGTVDLPIVTGSTTNPITAPSTATDAGPTTAAQARSLLKGMTGGNTGTAGSGFNFANQVTVPAPARPIVADAGPGVDRRLLESSTNAPPIEITALALNEAKTLDIPEKLDDDFDYLVTRFRPEIGGGLFQSAKPDQYSYFRVDVTAKRSLRKLKTMPKDVVFLIDTSGSVPQAWVNSMTRGIGDALGTLNEGDRFNIMFFSERATLFSDDKIALADTRTIAAAQQFLKGGTSKGNTDINRSLTRLLQRDTSAQRAYYLVLLSDGVPTTGVMDTRELINLVTRDNDLTASIYCVGVGNYQNKELLNFLAYRNKGFSTFVKEPEQAAGAVRDLMSRIRYPIIKDVSLNAIGLDFEEVFPHNLPNIHQGETFSVYGRYENAGAFTMRVGGFNGLKGMDVTFGGDLRTAAIGKESIPEDWAFWKLHHIYSEMIRRGESNEYKAKIAELKKRFDLKTLY